MPNQSIVPRRRLLLAGAGVALLAGCAAPAHVPAPPGAGASPRVRTGDRWRYAEIDLYRRAPRAELTMQVLDDAAQLRVGVTDADGAPRPDEVYASPWRVVREPAYGEVIEFRYPNPVLPRRLDTGGTERLNNAFRAFEGDLWHFWSEWIDALGWERVRVPAGEFVALRVQRRINFDHQSPFRVQSVRDETLWYSPDINRWVRREWTGRYKEAGMAREPPLREDWIAWELLEYRPA